MLILGNEQSNPITITEDQTSDEAVVIVNKNVSFLAKLKLTNKYLRAEVKGVFKEFGYGNPLTNSYINIADADSYLTVRYSDWAVLSDSAKSKHILIGSKYLESNFDFLGDKINRDQSLSFPRQFDTAGRTIFYSIPLTIKDVACECAYLAFKLKILPTNSGAKSSSNITEEKKKVGPLETVTKYDVSEKSVIQGETGSSSYTYIQKLLRDFISDKNSSSVANKFELDY